MEAWWGWALSLAMVFTIIFYLSWPAWKLQHIPCPPYMWGVGHLPLMMKEKAQVFVRLAKEYGPVYRYVILPIVGVLTPNTILATWIGSFCFTQLISNGKSQKFKGPISQTRSSDILNFSKQNFTM